MIRNHKPYHYNGAYIYFSILNCQAISEMLDSIAFDVTSSIE